MKKNIGIVGMGLMGQAFILNLKRFYKINDIRNLLSLS